MGKSGDYRKVDLIMDVIVLVSLVVDFDGDGDLAARSSTERHAVSSVSARIAKSTFSLSRESLRSPALRLNRFR